MIIAFWIALAAAVTSLVSLMLASACMDSGPAMFLPLAQLSGVVAVIVGVVFVLLFGLDALGVTINISGEH